MVFTQLWVHVLRDIDIGRKMIEKSNIVREANFLLITYLIEPPVFLSFFLFVILFLREGSSSPLMILAFVVPILRMIRQSQ